MLEALRDAPIMTPGSYLRICRETAGLSVAHVAKACVSSPVDYGSAAIEIAEAEADRALLPVSDLVRLMEFVPLVPAIYTALAYGLPCRPFCWHCGTPASDKGQLACACAGKLS
jgi:hypothetical protein